MISSWTKHLKDQDEIESFASYVKGSKRLLDRLTELLTEQLIQLDNSEVSLRDYDTPNWEYRQAHRNGQRAVLKSMLRLINLDQKE